VKGLAWRDEAMSEEVVYVRPMYNLQPVSGAVQLDEEDESGRFLYAAHQGMLLRVRTVDAEYQLFDADARVCRRGHFDLWLSGRRATSLQLLADKLLVTFCVHHAAFVVSIADAAPRVVFAERQTDEDWADSWRSTSSALSPDGEFVYRVAAIDKRRCELLCWNVEKKELVVRSPIESTLDGSWTIEVAPLPAQAGWIVYCHLYAGQDGSEHQKLIHRDGELREVENDRNYSSPVDILLDTLEYSHFEPPEGTGDEDDVRIDPELDLLFNFHAVSSNWRRETALALCDSGLAVVVDMDDPARVKELVVFRDALLTDRTQLFRGFHTRLWTVSPFALWEAAPLFETFHEWVDWTPAHHYLFSQSFRNAVKTLLLCTKRLMGGRVPRDMRRLLVQYAARAWLHGANMCDSRQTTLTPKKRYRAKKRR
jgi:hypothetical protein